MTSSNGEVLDRRMTDQEQLQALRLDALGAAAALITHELNNILMVTLNAAALAQRWVEPGGLAARALREIETASGRAAKLTAQLVTFTPGGIPVTRPMILEDLLRAATDAALTGSSTTSSYEIETGLWSVEVDEVQMAQALTNLARDARAAMRDAGDLKVRARNLLVENSSAIPLGRYVEVDITDAGDRIALRDVHRIFDPFFVERRGGGLALASALCILKRHNGALWADTDRERGVGFKALIPAADTEPGSSPRVKRPSQDPETD